MPGFRNCSSGTVICPNFSASQLSIRVWAVKVRELVVIISSYLLAIWIWEELEMARLSKTRNILEDFVREGSFKWLVGNRSSFEEEVEDKGQQTSGSGDKSWIPELSSVANVVVRRCTRILGVPVNDLQKEFDSSASQLRKDPSQYARNLLEFCCFRALALSTHVTGHLADAKFRHLTFDMMLAWESPAANSQPLLNLDEDATVGKEAFYRISPALPIIANVIIVNSLFEVLTASTGGRLQYSTYEKYLLGLEKAIKKLKNHSASSLLSAFRSDKNEKILDVDGTVTTQPVLQHVGASTWPGRLILTDHALYFEPLRVVSYDKAKRYDLEEDSKQVVRPEMTGPWGTRLFDKAVSYKSISVSEPVVVEFPELKGNTRRDYWLVIIQEILFVHKFISKFQLTGNARDEALLKAVLGIVRLQAIRDVVSVGPLRYDSLLAYTLCDNLPGGDLILETLATMLASRESERAGSPRVGNVYSVSALAMASSLGFGLGSTSNEENDCGIVVGEIVVGGLTPLEKAVKESRSNYEKVVMAQETVDGVRVEGIDTNLAVMKELLHPVLEIWRSLESVFLWEDVVKSTLFCLIFTFIIIRGWIGYLPALMLIIVVVFMVMSRCFVQDEHIDRITVIAPPPKSKMEQILALQNAVSQAEEFIQDANIILLKLRALMLAIFPQASDKCVLVLLILALFFALVPIKYILLTCFLEVFTRYAPPRKAATERLHRRLKEWWFSIPAAPVVLETDKEDKKKK
ncbi:hypothetical protein V2J09_014871 [Rumex salicifolius]